MKRTRTEKRKRKQLTYFTSQHLCTIALWFTPQKIKSKENTMGKPALNKVGRKIAKKIERVTDAESTQAVGEGVVPAEALPAPIPEEHLMTKRERMLKKVFAKKSNSTQAVKKTSSKKKATTTVLKDADEEADDTTANDEGFGEDHQPSTSNSVVSGMRKLKGMKLDGAVRAAAAKLTREQQQQPVQQTKTSLNLSSAQRHDMFVSELNLFNRVNQMQAFQDDPFGSIQQHLDSTMRKLQPQTDNVGRKQLQSNVSAPVPRQPEGRWPRRK